MKNMQIKLDAEWKNDCQGKKDYDGPILCISSRYWPAGGGFLLVHNENGKVTFQDGIEGIRPSATCALILRNKDSEDDIELAKNYFEGDSFEDVAKQVEMWAQQHVDRAIKVLMTEFMQEKLVTKL